MLTYLVLFYMVFLTMPILLILGYAFFGSPRLYDRRHDLLARAQHVLADVRAGIRGILSRS